MAKDRLSGKLAVILHADIAESTVLVQQDERLAHERIQDTFRRFSETIEKYQGHVRELRGDALLADFERSSDAVTASLAFQADHASYIENLNDDIRPVARIGIAMGEVIIADNTVTGAGVVLAQRVEQLSEPGGVCITAAIHEGLPKRLPFEQEDLGEQKLKGFDDLVKVYSVSLKPGGVIPETATLAQPETAAPALPDKPSIAVLPFTNMSGNPEQEYFSDGITEDIRTGLSRFRELLVIARGSSSLLKDKALDTAEVAEKLGVRFVLQGSVRIAGDRVRITAQLIDGQTGSHIWAEAYDRVLNSVFEVQDDVTQTIVATLARRLEKAGCESALKKSNDDLTVYDLLLRARNHFPDWKCTKENILQARELYERAIELDPNCAAAYSGISGTYNTEFLSQWTNERELAGERSFEYARKALSLDDCDSTAHLVLACAYRDIRSNLDLAVSHLNKAIDANPNDYSNYCCKCGLMIITGDFDESISCAQEAIRRSPLLPDDCLCGIGFAEYLSGRYERAITSFGEILNPDALIEAYIAACYAQLGRNDEALAAATAFQKINKESPAIIEERKPKSWCTHLSNLWHFTDSGILDHFIEGLRRAGVVD